MTSGSTKWSMTVQIRIEATTAKSVTSARHLVRVGVRVRVRVGVRVGHLRPQPSGVLKVPPSVAYTHLITLADCGERTTPAAEGE